MSARDLTAPCGVDCFNCEVYEGLITPERRAALAKRLQMDESAVACKGCREQKGCRLHWGACATLDCITAKGVEFCSDCAEFPCTKLQPVAAAVSPYPHNLKLFNLCRIKAVGAERWSEEAADIRRRYFQGKFVVGAGPVLD
jgi:hypothetical protein